MTEAAKMNPTTLVFLLVVSSVYGLFILRRMIRTKMDLFDGIFLFTVVAIPCVFGLFEGPLTEMTHAIGVKYPFVLMFALIHACTFLYFSYLASRLNHLRHREVRLIQEISLLKEEVKRLAVR